MRDVEALVALEPDQACVERGRERLRSLGLADSGLALEQHWLLEREREERRRREAAIARAQAALGPTAATPRAAGQVAV